MTNQWLGVGTGTLVRISSFGVEGYGVVTEITTDPVHVFGQVEPIPGSLTYAVEMRDGRTRIDIRPDEIEAVDLTDPEQQEEWLRHG